MARPACNKQYCLRNISAIKIANNDYGNDRLHIPKAITTASDAKPRRLSHKLNQLQRITGCGQPAFDGCNACNNATGTASIGPRMILQSTGIRESDDPVAAIFARWGIGIAPSGGQADIRPDAALCI